MQHIHSLHHHQMRKLDPEYLPKIQPRYKKVINLVQRINHFSPETTSNCAYNAMSISIGMRRVVGSAQKEPHYRRISVLDSE